MFAATLTDLRALASFLRLWLTRPLAGATLRVGGDGRVREVGFDPYAELDAQIDGTKEWLCTCPDDGEFVYHRRGCPAIPASACTCPPSTWPAALQEADARCPVHGGR